ncbi:MAG: transposase [Phycisphaerales bacterium]|nr:MAG: transposase [Phycisphaerales bacterium]
MERFIGSIRRECLSHVIILNKRYLRRILRSYLDYYHHSRTHLSLGRNSPAPREVEPPERGKVISLSPRGLNIDPRNSPSAPDSEVARMHVE